MVKIKGASVSGEAEAVTTVRFLTPEEFDVFSSNGTCANFIYRPENSMCNIDQGAWMVDVNE